MSEIEQDKQKFTDVVDCLDRLAEILGAPKLSSSVSLYTKNVEEAVDKVKTEYKLSDAEVRDMQSAFPTTCVQAFSLLFNVMSKQLEQQLGNPDKIVTTFKDYYKQVKDKDAKEHENGNSEL